MWAPSEDLRFRCKGLIRCVLLPAGGGGCTCDWFLSLYFLFSLFKRVQFGDFFFNFSGYCVDDLLRFVAFLTVNIYRAAPARLRHHGRSVKTQRNDFLFSICTSRLSSPLCRRRPLKRLKNVKPTLEMYLYKILLIIIPLHIVYFAFICNILILWGNLFYCVNIIIIIE